MAPDGSPARAPAGRERLPRSARIRHGTEIRHLFRKGRRLRRQHLEAFVAPGDGARSRFGLVVPKHGHDIVDRNLLKRRLREFGRRELLPMLAESGRSLRVLVRTRPSAYRADVQALRAEILAIGTQLCSDASWSD